MKWSNKWDLKLKVKKLGNAVFHNDKKNNKKQPHKILEESVLQLKVKNYGFD